MNDAIEIMKGVCKYRVRGLVKSILKVYKVSAPLSLYNYFE